MRWRVERCNHPCDHAGAPMWVAYQPEGARPVPLDQHWFAWEEAMDYATGRTSKHTCDPIDCPCEERAS